MEAFVLSLLVSVLLQFIFGSLAILQKTDKYTDLTYSINFIILAIINFFLSNALPLPILLINSFVILWGLRLGTYLFIRISKIKKDDRFDQIRTNPLRFLMFWVFQAISVPVIMLPVTLSSASTTQKTSLDNLQYLFSFLWIAGFLIQTVADAQKYQFKNDPENKGRWIMTGLWKYSRHPNYFGELLMWWSIFLLALESIPSSQLFLAILGPIHISVLILFITGIPTLEKRYDEIYGTNKEFQNYKRRTSLLIPLPALSK